MDDIALFEEIIKEPTLTGNGLLNNLDKATSNVIQSFDTAHDPIMKPTSEITIETLVNALEEMGRQLRLPEGTIRKGVNEFRSIIDNKRES